MVKLDLKPIAKFLGTTTCRFFLGDFIDGKGDPLGECPRQTLKRVLKKAEKMGVLALCGMEYEWFNFRETPQSFAEKHYTHPEPISPGMFGYSLIRMGQNQPFFKALMEEMPKFGIPIEGLHTETGPACSKPRYSILKRWKRRTARFYSSKPRRKSACASALCRASWRNGRSNIPAVVGTFIRACRTARKIYFTTRKDKHGMSAMFKSYLAGQLKVLPELMPIYAPTINSYKRLVDGFWAPVKPTWGVDNRTASFRVISGSPKSTRLETRCPGADVNAYLAMAACLAAGLARRRKKS